jgi:molecular chaperone GrpE
MPDSEATPTETQTAAANADAGTPGAGGAAPGPNASDAETNAGDAQTTATDIAAELAGAKAEVAASYDKYMRAVADLENFRRRAVREKDELRTIATGRVLEDIFPVLDNLALAVAAAKQPNADLKSLVGGIEMVLAQLKSALSSHGLKEINPAGQAFDPHQHEAISHEPSPKVKEEHVINVVRTGYALNGRLLRPAAVVVSSGPAKPANEKPA